ncbi:hypothetical protein [Nostoc sp.]
MKVFPTPGTPVIIITRTYATVSCCCSESESVAGLTQTIAEKNDFQVGAIHELPLPRVVLRKSCVGAIAVVDF